MSYVTINMQEIAEYQHGPGAKAVCTGDHAYHWRALLPNGLTAGMDLQAFADKKYGSNWRAVLINASKDGWAWYNPFRVNQVVQPVIMVAQDLKWDITAIDGAIKRYRKLIAYAQSWYKAKAGRTFEIAPFVQIVLCSEKSDAMLAIARKTTEKNADGSSKDRWALVNYHQDKYYASVNNRVNTQIQYVCASFTGNHPSEDYGSANRGNITALSSDNTSLDINPSNWTYATAKAAWDTIHEIGHGLGMAHPTEFDDGPNWKASIMYNGVPDGAILHPREIKFLGTHPMLKVV